jgi:hypothetical protein
MALVSFIFSPSRTSSRPRAPEAFFSASGTAQVVAAKNAWPNLLVNLTRNGVRQSAGKVSCAHSSSPAARRTPLRSGYQQRSASLLTRLDRSAP